MKLFRERYPLPVIEIILSENKVNLKSGYWHCQQDEESSLLATTITPFERYRWLQSPFCTYVSSVIFQRKLPECIEGLKGVVSVADDIFIWRKWRTLLEKIPQSSTEMFRYGKSTTRTDQLNFIGHIIKSQGMKSDLSKIKAIFDMEFPKDK